MPTCEITPRSPTRTSTSSRGFDSRISDHQQDNVGAISSRQNEGSPGPLRIIAVAMKAHEKMRIEPFSYAINHLVEQRNCKVVVICCLSRVRNEMGVELTVDLQHFGGISRKKLDAAIKDQTNALNHFFKPYKNKLNEKGVELDIRVSPGHNTFDILMQMAHEIHPCWVVLDHSFRHQKRILKALDCNLVLIKKNFRDSKPLILRSTPKHFSPADQTHEQVSETIELSSARNSISESPRSSISDSARSSISERARNSISESARNSISESARNSISERARNSILETRSRDSISNGANPTITIKASSSNGPTATITVETYVGVHNTTNRATSDIHSQTPSTPPVPLATQGLQTLRSAFTSSPPHLSSPPITPNPPTTQGPQTLRSAFTSSPPHLPSSPTTSNPPTTQGLPTLRSAFTSPQPHFSSPPTTPNPPTRSIPPVPPLLSSPTSVPTQRLEGLRFPAPQFSFPATPRPNLLTPTSSGSGTSAGLENQSTSRTPSEPVYAISRAEVPSHTVLPEQSRPPAPPVVSPTLVSTRAGPFSSFSAASQNSPSSSKSTRPACPGSFFALKNYINDIKKAASKPKVGVPSGRTSTPNSSGSGTSTTQTNRPIPYEAGQANRPIPLRPNVQIPYDVELAMALNASIVSASREGVPISPTARQSIPSDGPLARQSEPIPDDVALALTLSASLQTASEEVILLSPPPPQNHSSGDGNRGNRGPQSTTNNADRPHFEGWVEIEHPSYSYTGWGPGSYAGTATSRSGHFSAPEIPSTSTTRIPSAPQAPRTGASSDQSATSTSPAPSAPPLPALGSTQYPDVGTSPAKVNYGTSAKVMGRASSVQKAKEKGGHCIICYDAQADAVCIPCGHMAGCKDCLTRIKSKGCPVCRATIQQVIKVYTVS